MIFKGFGVLWCISEKNFELLLYKLKNLWLTFVFHLIPHTVWPGEWASREILPSWRDLLVIHPSGKLTQIRLSDLDKYWIFPPVSSVDHTQPEKSFT